MHQYILRDRPCHQSNQLRGHKTQAPPGPSPYECPIGRCVPSIRYPLWRVVSCIPISRSPLSSLIDRGFQIINTKRKYGTSLDVALLIDWRKPNPRAWWTFCQRHSAGAEEAVTGDYSTDSILTNLEHFLGFGTSESASSYVAW